MKLPIRPIAVYIAAVVVLVGALSTIGWTATWTALGVPTMYPPFADMRTVQGALTTMAAGGDPRVLNIGDPWLRSLNYPSLWVTAAQRLGWQVEWRFIASVLAMVVAYGVVCGILL